MVKYARSRARGLLGKAMEERTWRKGEFLRREWNTECDKPTTGS